MIFWGVISCKPSVGHHSSLAGQLVRSQRLVLGGHLGLGHLREELKLGVIAPL